MKKAPEKDNKLMQLTAVIALALCAGILILIVLDDRNFASEPTSVKAVKSPEEINRLLNKHLKSTNHRIEHLQDVRRIENFHTSPKVGQKLNFYQQGNGSLGVEMGLDINEENTRKDLQRRGANRYDYSPGTIVQKELADQEAQQKLDSQIKQKYAQQFVENAKRKGWEIELSDDFVVRSVKKIKPDQDPRLFPGASAEK